MAYAIIKVHRSPKLQLVNWRPRRASSWQTGRLKTQKKLIFQFKSDTCTHRNISLSALSRLSTNWSGCTHISKRNLLYLAYWFKLILNILTNTTRMFDQMIGYPVSQSNWNIKLIISLGNVKLQSWVFLYYRATQSLQYANCITILHSMNISKIFS